MLFETENIELERFMLYSQQEKKGFLKAVEGTAWTLQSVTYLKYTLYLINDVICVDTIMLYVTWIMYSVGRFKVITGYKVHDAIEFRAELLMYDNSIIWMHCIVCIVECIVDQWH